MTNTVTKTKTPLSGLMASRHARLARHVLKQALRDVRNRMQVDIDSLRPWAFLAGIPQSSLEKSFRSAAGMKPGRANAWAPGTIRLRVIEAEGVLS